jgi:hypothetical protein
MCSYTTLIYGPIEKVGDLWIIAPCENPQIPAIIRKEIKWPKDLIWFELVRMLQLQSAFPREQILDSSAWTSDCLRQVLWPEFGNLVASPSISRVALQAVHEDQAANAIRGLLKVSWNVDYSAMASSGLWRMEKPMSFTVGFGFNWLSCSVFSIRSWFSQVFAGTINIPYCFKSHATAWWSVVVKSLPRSNDGGLNWVASGQRHSRIRRSFSRTCVLIGRQEGRHGFGCIRFGDKGIGYKRTLNHSIFIY